MDLQLSGQLALVTASTGGIGRETARALAREGATVIVNGRTAASVAEAVWRWLSDRSSVWTAIERITPENADARERAAFELAVIAALDAPRTARLETRNCAARQSCAPQGAQSKEREGERT